MSRKQAGSRRGTIREASSEVRREERAGVRHDSGVRSQSGVSQESVRSQSGVRKERSPVDAQDAAISPSTPATPSAATSSAAPSVADMRREYMAQGLSEHDIDADPFRQFQVWFEQALAANMIEPNAMALATATPDGHPSARMVLLKGYDARGFVWYTNYESRKGGDLAVNPYAALVFFWPELSRQVRIEGTVTQVST